MISTTFYALETSLKQIILNDHFDLLKLQREWSFYMYRGGLNGDYPFEFEYVINLQNQVERYLKDPDLLVLWREAERINNAFWARKRRLKKRIVSMYIRAPSYFGTLTFTDEVLLSTSADTRRSYVQRFLKMRCIDYVANCDYGSINKREHYHCVCIPYDFSSLDWSFGWSNFKLIRNSASDFQRVSTYLTKLTNHALKYTTKNSKIIYSRG